MKLLDILVRDLKEWPENMNEHLAPAVAQDNDGLIVALDDGAVAAVSHFGGSLWTRIAWTGTDIDLELADDHSSAIITRDQWQAAIDAPVQAESPAAWSGDGLPPVGTVCIFNSDRIFDGDWHQLLPLHEDLKVSVIAHCLQPITGMTVAVFTFECDGGIQVEMGVSEMFSPIPTAEQIEAQERQVLELAACSDIEHEVERFNVTTDCSAAMRATVNAMIAKGYRKADAQ